MLAVRRWRRDCAVDARCWRDFLDAVGWLCGPLRELCLPRVGGSRSTRQLGQWWHDNQRPLQRGCTHGGGYGQRERLASGRGSRFHGRYRRSAGRGWSRWRGVQSSRRCARRAAFIRWRRRRVESGRASRKQWIRYSGGQRWQEQRRRRRRRCNCGQRGGWQQGGWRGRQWNRRRPQQLRDCLGAVLGGRSQSGRTMPRMRADAECVRVVTAWRGHELRLEQSLSCGRLSERLLDRRHILRKRSRESEQPLSELSTNDQRQRLVFRSDFPLRYGDCGEWQRLIVRGSQWRGLLLGRQHLWQPRQ